VHETYSHSILFTRDFTFLRGWNHCKAKKLYWRLARLYPFRLWNQGKNPKPLWRILTETLDHKPHPCFKCETPHNGIIWPLFCCCYGLPLMLNSPSLLCECTKWGPLGKIMVIDSTFGRINAKKLKLKLN
jgi:hypothetical protein